jgi:hypothetical protein
MLESGFWQKNAIMAKVRENIFSRLQGKSRGFAGGYAHPKLELFAFLPVI